MICSVQIQSPFRSSINRAGRPYYIQTALPCRVVNAWPVVYQKDANGR